MQTSKHSDLYDSLIVQDYPAPSMDNYNKISGVQQYKEKKKNPSHDTQTSKHSDL